MLIVLMWLSTCALASEAPADVPTADVPEVVIRPVSRFVSAGRWHRAATYATAAMGTGVLMAAAGGAIWLTPRLLQCGWSGLDRCSLPFGVGLLSGGLAGSNLLAAPVVVGLAVPAMVVAGLGTAGAIRRGGGRVSVVPGIVGGAAGIAAVGFVVDDTARGGGPSARAWPWNAVGALAAGAGFAGWQVALNAGVLRRGTQVTVVPRLGRDGLGVMVGARF